MTAERQTGLLARVEALNATVRGESAPHDGVRFWEDGHARWELYREAAGSPSSHALLLDAVRAETDGPLASAVVVLVLETAPADERALWVEALPPEVRDFAERRAEELAVLDALDRCDEGRESGGYSAQDLDTWSDWLQLRAAGPGRPRRLLDLLAEHGRTKRIRRTAAEARATPGRSGTRGTR
ncbi:hypothetical protein AB0M42_21275 [Streptomyces sp. NPDC051784]|uniref:hypothetical protein n=1 Tax=Streptomyces sp. NPDC051784 TaxID=3155805 RepID=UPI003438162A